MEHKLVGTNVVENTEDIDMFKPFHDFLSSIRASIASGEIKVDC